MVNNTNKKFTILMLMAVFLFASIPLAFATTITIDGGMNDWFLSGLDLSVGGDGNFSHSWTTHSDVYGVVDNLRVGDPFPPPYGGEIYDIEAMFMTADNNNIYLAIVSSFPKDGTPIVGGSGYYQPGDIALSVDNPSPDAGWPDWGYEYGFVVNSHDGFAEGTLYNVSMWSFADHNNSPDIILSGSSAGTGTFVYTKRTDLPLENGYSTWVIEASIPKNLFSGLDENLLLAAHWTTTCGNDGINLAAIPEPATLLLTGSGLIGIAGLIRRKKRHLLH